MNGGPQLLAVVEYQVGVFSVTGECVVRRLVAESAQTNRSVTLPGEAAIS